MSFDQVIYAARAKASLALALTPGFTPEPPTSKEGDETFEQDQRDFAAVRAQIHAAVADAVRRAAVQSIAIGVSERAMELWTDLDASPSDLHDLAAAAESKLDAAVYTAIAAYLSTVKE